MATRLKGNKGYFSLLGADAVWGGVMIGITLGLVNLPLALLALAVNLGADVMGGIVTGPKKPAVPVPSAENAAPAVKPGLLKRGKNFTRQWFSYMSAGFKDPDYVVGSASAGAGLNIFFQAVLGIHSILTTHSLLLIGSVAGTAATAGIGACVAAAAVGLYLIFAGKIEKWRGTNKFYAAAFNKNDPNAGRQSFLQKLSHRPRIQKVLNSKVARGIKKYLMIGATAESSFFSVGASAAVLTKYGASVIAAPHKILTAAIPMALAVRWGGAAMWHMVCAGRLTVRGHVQRWQERKRVKKAAKAARRRTPTVEPALDLAPDPLPAPAADITPIPDQVSEPAVMVAAVNTDTLAKPLATDPSAKPLAATFDNAAGTETPAKTTPARKPRNPAASRTRTPSSKP